MSIWKNKQDVKIQNQFTPFNDFYFIQANGAPTTLTSAISDPESAPTRFIDVASVVNISIGDWLGIFSGSIGSERYYFAEVMDINVLQLEMQTLIDYPFPIGAVVLSTTRDMNVDGSVTPQIFQIQAGSPTGKLAIDITRVLVECQTASAVDLSKFGDIIGGLTYGMYLRSKENGTFRNKAIIRLNSEFGLFALDWKPFATTNPVQGQDGFLWRFTINGPDKHGVTNRIIGNINTLHWVIQDNQTAINLLRSVGANYEVD